MPTFIYIPSASSAAWTPSDLADLVCWLDASDSSTVFDATTGGSLPADGSAVARLEDKSGGGKHLTQATSGNRPVRQTSEVNSRDVLEFASSADFMTTTSQPFGSSLSEYTCLGVLRTRASSLSDDHVWTLDKQALVINSNGSLSFDTLSGGESRATSSASSVAAGTTYLLGVEYKGSTDVQKIRKNGASIADAAANSVPTSVSIGSTNGFELGLTATSYTFDGMFCELVFCDVLLSSTDREKLEGYLAHRWGIAGDLDSAHPYKNSAP